MNREFPTDEKYLEFTERLSRYKNLRLTCGNCGIFAYALKKAFNDGELFNVGGFAHILLKRNDKFYDGETIYESIDDLQDSHWGQYFDEEYEVDDNLYYTGVISQYEDKEAYRAIKKATCNNQNYKYFLDIINSELP